MVKGPEQLYVPVEANTFGTYLKSEVKPPLDIHVLSLDLLIGEERKVFERSLPTNGDWSFVLKYRRKEAYVASFEEEVKDDILSLQVTQLQGGRNGYRVMTGMNVVGLITDQVNILVNHPESPYSFLFMPRTLFVAGIMGATDAAIQRYEQAARKLGLEYSEEQKLFIRKLS